MQIDAAGDIVAETDRYTARFENGVLAYFHNRLTQETYTYAKATNNSKDWQAGQTIFTTLHKRINHLKSIEKTSPLQVEITYKEHGGLHHIVIGIDPANDDLFVEQTGVHSTGGVEKLSLGFKNISRETVDLILPAMGGIIITQENTERLNYNYPGDWEAQLAIFQGRRGGFFIRADDTQFRFKELFCENEGDEFRLSFLSIAFAPFQQQRHISTKWRLNTYQGDWDVPAQIYQNWMHKAFQDFEYKRMPAWVNDIECVIKYHADLDIKILKRLNELTDPSKTLIYVYSWHNDGGDPPRRRDGFKSNLGYFIKQAQWYGFKIMLHTSISHIQADEPSYVMFEKYHVRDPYTGEKEGYKLNDPTYHSPAATINPASSEFRKMLVSELKYVWDTYGFDAIHLDFSIHVKNDKNGRIDGLTMAEGVVALHQEIRSALPNIVISGESLTELSAPYEELAQRWFFPEYHKPHPISSVLFPNVRFYGHLGLPNPDDDPEQFDVRQEEYATWGVLPTITVWDIETLAPDRFRTHQILEIVRQRQNYVFGDINKDGIVNILDLVLVSRNIGEIDKETDINGDGIVNILDLVLISQRL